MKRRSGFTLLEVMVAVSVTLVLVILMLRIFSDGSTAWMRNDEKLDTYREARAALQTISRDFSNLNPLPRPEATSTPTGTPGPTATPIPMITEVLRRVPLLALEVHPDTAEEDRVNEEIYGLVPVRNEGKSRLCAVGYYCIWDQARRAFVLRRQCTESNTTYANLQAAIHYLAPKTREQMLASLFARGLDEDFQSDEVLATYVWDFHIRLPNRPIGAATPAPTPPAGSGSGSTDLYRWPHGTFNRELPEWMEVRFKALGSNAARKIENLNINRSTWFDPSNDLYQKYILPGEQEFVTRIRLCR